MSDNLRCAVYVISCKITGKRYVGITKKAYTERYTEHLYSARKGEIKVLYAAIRKYGEHNFVCMEICTASSWKNACFIEQLLIKEFNCITPNGYNMTAGGEGTVGWSASVEVREVWSKQRAGRVWTDEQNSARSARVKDQWADPEIRRARQESMCNRKWTDEQRANRSKSMKGKPVHKNFAGVSHTAESKAKISAAVISRYAKQRAEKEQVG